MDTIQRPWIADLLEQLLNIQVYFLDVLITNDAFCRELGQVSFRNFAHQQQYYAWQNRFMTLYGSGEAKQIQNNESQEQPTDESPAVPTS